MYRFFVNHDILESDEVKISGEDYNHIRNVLRMKEGDRVLLSDGRDREYEADITGFDESGSHKAVLLRITDVFGSSRELPVKLTLFQGYPKGDKMEGIVKRAVELGVYEIVPVMMNRCVVKLDSNKAAKKVERLNSIALSAAKQSKRGVIPKVTGVMTLKEAAEYAKTLGSIIVPYENAEGMEYSRAVMQGIRGEASAGIFIGPEGGFEGYEIEELENAGAKTVSLGHRILRTETAGTAVLSVLMYMLDE